MRARVERRAKLEAREEMERRLRQSGLPKAYASGERSLAHLPSRYFDTVSACAMLGRRLGDKVFSGLYLHGEAGSFKTSVAAAWLADAIRKGNSGRFVCVPDLFTDLYAIYSGVDSGRSRADIVGPLIAAKCLVLDDLGKEKASDHAAEVIFEILDGRYREGRDGRWLIVTSNLPHERLAARFPFDSGDPILRRLSELTIPVAMERAV